MVLVLDGSGSVGGDTFRLQLSFAAQLAKRLNVSAEGSHLAIVQYAESPHLEIALGQNTSVDQVGKFKISLHV